MLEMKKDIIEYIHSNIDGVKQNVSKLDIEMLDHIEESTLAFVSLVLLDKRNNEFKVGLSTFIDNDYKDNIIYQGHDIEVATQIVNNLLEAFDNTTYAEFGEDGNFSM
jgi:hypothetical protein